MKRAHLLSFVVVAVGVVVGAQSREAHRVARYVGLQAALRVPLLTKMGPLVGLVACEPNELSSDHAAEDLRFAVNLGTYSASGATEVSVTASLAEGGVLDLDTKDKLFLEDDLGAEIPASEVTSVARLDAEQHPRVTFYRDGKLIRTMPLPLVRVIATRVPDRAAYDIRLVGAGVSDLSLSDSEGLPLRAKFAVEVDDTSQAWDAQSMDAIALFASDATTRVPMVKDCESCVSRTSVVIVGSALSPSFGSWATYSFNPALVFEATPDEGAVSDAHLDAGTRDENDATIAEFDAAPDAG